MPCRAAQMKSLCLAIKGPAPGPPRRAVESITANDFGLLTAAPGDDLLNREEGACRAATILSQYSAKFRVKRHRRREPPEDEDTGGSATSTSRRVTARVLRSASDFFRSLQELRTGLPAKPAAEG